MEAETPRRKDELYFEQLGDDFENFMSDFDVDQRIVLIEKLMSEVSAAKKNCLELGCGTGRISIFLKEHFEGLTVSDLSEKLTEDVARKLSVSGQASDAMNLCFSNDQFDWIISSEMVEHTPSPTKALQEMARVLKPGGHMIVTSPNKLWYPLIWFTTKTGLRKFQGNEVWLSPSQASKILEESGLRIRRVGGCHMFPWQIPFAKTVLPFFNRFHRQLYPLMINWGILAEKPVAE